MLSRTEVINNALQVIAANAIDTPDEPSESARQTKAIYDQTVREELEKQAWLFAKGEASLPETAGAETFRYARSFQLPSDFIRLVTLEDRWVFDVLRYTVDTDPTSVFAIQGRSIVTSLGAPLGIEYIRDLSGDPTVWPPLFAGAVSAALAVKVAMPLTKSGEMVKLAASRYKEALRDAKKSNAIQQPPAHIPDSSWVVSRFA